MQSPQPLRPHCAQVLQARTDITEMGSFAPGVPCEYCKYHVYASRRCSSQFRPAHGNQYRGPEKIAGPASQQRSDIAASFATTCGLGHLRKSRHARQYLRVGLSLGTTRFLGWSTDCNHLDQTSLGRLTTRVKTIDQAQLLLGPRDG